MFELAGCPRRLRTADVVWAIKAYEMDQAGRTPVAGGWLDQTAIGLAAIEMIAFDVKQWEARAKAGAAS